MASEARSFPCNTCSITFTSSELQRSHMRQPWHIHNLRRRVAELPAISKDQYNADILSQNFVTPPKKSDDKRKGQAASYEAETLSEATAEHVPVAEDTMSDVISPTRCLFCNQDSLNLDANIDHMSLHHGLFVPSQEQLSDVGSFFGYLAVIVFECKECLYCGLQKATVDSVQTHMRDKGHCMIKIDATSELLDFWEFSDSEEEDRNHATERTATTATKLSETEMRLPSGAIINSRSDSSQLRARPGLEKSRTRSSQHRIKKDDKKAITAGDHQHTTDDDRSPPSRSNDRRIAVRGELGLIGVPESQRRALQITEKKMKRREAVANAAYQHAMEQQPVKTVYYKTENPVYQAG